MQVSRELLEHVRVDSLAILSVISVKTACPFADVAWVMYLLPK